MIREFVADASITIAWIHRTQATEESLSWLDLVSGGAGIVVPALWHLEVSNALLVLERRGKLKAAERAQALQILRRLPITSDFEFGNLALTVLSDLATKEALSVYDAVYLELALRRSLPLGCKDGPLRAAAIRHGIAVSP